MTAARKPAARTYDDLVALAERILDLGDSPEDLMESADLVGDALEELGEPTDKVTIEALRDHFSSRF